MKKTIGIIIKYILIGLLVALVLGLFYHNVYLKSKISKPPTSVQLIDIDGEKLSVTRLGSGDKTVVLLPGHGVALPSADFAPLSRILSEDYSVAIVEYFGLGFSDITKSQRTNENFVKEIRLGLKGAGLKPPYILMPHSISNVYSEYYAREFPDEVEGIFVLDGTLVSEAKISEFDSIINGEPYMLKVFKKTKLMQIIGLQDLMYKLIPKSKYEEIGFPFSIANGYTEEEIKTLKIFIARNINNNMIDQLGNLGKDIEDLLAYKDKIKIPVFRVISNESHESAAAISQLKNLTDINGYEFVNRDHFVYHANEKQIKELFDEFIKNYY